MVQTACEELQKLCGIVQGPTKKQLLLRVRSYSYYYSVHNPAIILEEMPKTYVVFFHNIMGSNESVKFFIQVTNKEINLAYNITFRVKAK